MTNLIVQAVLALFEINKILKDCNYILAFTTKGGRVYPGSDPLQLPRVRMSKGDSLNAFVSKIK